MTQKPQPVSDERVGVSRGHLNHLNWHTHLELHQQPLHHRPHPLRPAFPHLSLLIPLSPPCTPTLRLCAPDQLGKSLDRLLLCPAQAGHCGAQDEELERYGWVEQWRVGGGGWRWKEGK